MSTPFCLCQHIHVVYIAKHLRVFLAAPEALDGLFLTLELSIGLGCGLIVLVLIVGFSVYCSCKKMQIKMLKELRMVERTVFEAGKQAGTKINVVYQSLETGHRAILVAIVTLSACANVFYACVLIAGLLESNEQSVDCESDTLQEACKQPRIFSQPYHGSEERSFLNSNYREICE